jgi:hypothetical protein
VGEKGVLMDWFRYYVETLDNRKIQELPGNTHKMWCNFMCLCRAYDGYLPEPETMAFRLRLSVPKVLKWRDELVALRLVDQAPDGRFTMHDWNEHQYVSDCSTPRVKKHRQKRERNVSGNAPDTDTDTDTEQKQTTDARMPLASQFPETAAAIRANVRSASDPLIVEVAHLAVQAYVDAVNGTEGMPALTDDLIAVAVGEAHFRSQENPYAYKTTVPRVVRSWVEEELRKQRTH